MEDESSAAFLESVLESLQGQQLLAALTGFIRQVVRLQTNADSNGIDSTADSLLSSLKDFIYTNARVETPALISNREFSQPSAASKGKLVTYTVALGNTKSLSNPYGMSQDFRKALNRIKKDTKQLVSNQFPIRLLAFDQNGRGVRLVDRDQAFQHIFDYSSAEISKLIAEHNNKEFYQILRDVGSHFKPRTKYAILSHTWLRDIPGDVVFSNWEHKESNPRGLRKIQKFCEVAAKYHQVTLAWMDTVCIDKASSSELDESIRSMYKWYSKADVCVAYLSETEELMQMHKDAWFTRGWTLQELLAPFYVEFYNKGWQKLRSDSTEITNDVILQQINKATTITKQELSLFKFNQASKVPISRILQMVSGRKVTRDEDSVYSVMGLLGVDIPTGYGEGAKKAFYRLMRELLNSRRNVLDIFNCGRGFLSKGILPTGFEVYQRRAPYFDNTGNEVASLLDRWTPLEPIMVTHLGVRIPFLLVPGLYKPLGWSDSASGKLPYGHFHGSTTVLLHMGDSRTFELLCRGIYMDSKISSRLKNNIEDRKSPFIATFGILNFGLEDKDIIIPDKCLSIPLNCGLKPTGTVGPSDSISILRCLHPVVLGLNSTRGNNTLLKSEVEGHGMQLVTLYL